VEAIERRTMLAATIVSEQLVGGDPRNAEGVVITFSEALDPATAQNLKNYRVGRRTDRRQRIIDNIDVQRRDRRHGLVRFESAVYDPATFSVTLTALEPFNVTRRFRTIRVLGRDNPNVGIRSADGTVLDGDNDGQVGGDSVIRYTFKRGHRVTWGELDGDNVTLSITGPGRIWVIRHTKEGKVLARGEALRVYIDKADPATSIVTGKVSGIGNGVATLQELVNTSTAQVQILTDPAFQIVRSIP
jgi:hypothetical protein